MKKIIFILIGLITNLSTFAKISEPIINQIPDFQITNLVTYDNISADVLFNESRLILSKMTGDGKSESIIDYSNFETKTIAIKTKLYIGAGKSFPLTKVHWDVYLNLITTIKIKDNKLQVKSNFTDFCFAYNAVHCDFLLPFYECYPTWKMNDKNKKKQYGVDKYHYWESCYEKAIKLNTETVIITYQISVCKSLDNITTEDDF